VDSTVDETTMGNNTTVGKDRGGHSMGNRVGHSVDHRVSNSHGVSHSSDGKSLGVGSGAIIGHLSHVSLDIISMVVDMLDPAVRKSHRVGAILVGKAIARLSSLEVGVGVVISDGVVVGVGGNLVSVDLSNGVGNSVGNHRGMVSRGSVDHGGMVGRGSVDQRGGMGNNSMSNESMSNNSVSNNSVSNNSVSYESVSDNTGNTASMGNVGVVRDSSHGGSEGLGLDSRPVLSLVRLRDGLVGGLSGTNSNNSVMSNNTMANNSMSNQAVTGEDLGGAVGSHHQGGDTEEGLHVAGL